MISYGDPDEVCYEMVQCVNQRKICSMSLGVK